MFGKNEIVGQRYFQSEDQLLVTSMFFTLQGEGPFAGRPALFIRLAKCNLACSFCDTYFDDGDWFTIDELARTIHSMIQNDPRMMRPVLVITGGEPMLQKGLPSFLRRVQDWFSWTQIESNGITLQPIPDGTVLVVSPKCSEKNGVPVQYLRPNVKVMARADCLKFVISADPDSPYHTIPQWAMEMRMLKTVYISPMNIYNDEPRAARQRRVEGKRGIEIRSTADEVISFWEPGLLNMEQNQRNHEYAARYCLENGLVLNLQMHLFASLA